MSGLTGWSSLLCVAAGLWTTTSGCEDPTYRDIGADLRVVIQRDDALVPPAMERLAARGRRSIVQIETALHTASPPAKLRMVQVLERIGDPEAIPILRHCARWENTQEVRAACATADRRLSTKG